MQQPKRKVSDALPKPLKTRIQRTLGHVAKYSPETAIGPTLDIRSVSGFEIACRRGTTDEDVIAHSFDNDVFFAGVPEYRPAEDHVFIDVGAHIGTFSLLAASKVPKGQVYAIEASRETFNLLRINVALNHATNIDLSHLALADSQGTYTLYYDFNHWGHTIVKPLSGHGETVTANSLANFMNAKNILHCHFMKLNCEGAEFPILLSAPVEVLHRFDTILVLYHCDLYTKYSKQALMAHLRVSGFNLTLREETHQRGWIVARNQATGDN